MTAAAPTSASNGRHKPATALYVAVMRSVERRIRALGLPRQLLRLLSYRRD